MKIPRKKYPKMIDMDNHDRESCFNKNYCNGKNALIKNNPCVCSCHSRIYQRKLEEEKGELLTK